MKKIAMVALCAMITILVTGCRTNMGGGILPFTKPVEQGKYTVVGDRVEVTESMWQLPYGLTAAKPGNVVLRCVDKAIANTPNSDALVEVGVNVEIVNFGVCQQIITRVVGTPVKLSE